MRRIASLTLALLMLSSCDAPAQPEAARTVRTIYGDVSGVEVENISIYKGIPYAAPPVGNLRWRPPRAPAAWEGVRDGSKFGNVCPQTLRPGYSEETLGDRPMGEDCLTLNIWTPEPGTDQAQPVMVWILPGSFLAGDGGMPRYDGLELAKQDTVTVTFNYRLGMLGQFAHPALAHLQADEPRGNYHLMDQIAALKWVRDNIAGFGGDPGNVTVFGMSAGGVSVNYLMASPAADHLFHKAISQSSGLRVSKPRYMAADGNDVPSLETEGRRITEDLGISGSKEDIAQSLRALSWQEILTYQTNNPLGTGGSLNPVVDGQIVVEGIGDTFREGRQHKVPYITGATSWEGSLLTWANSADPVLAMLRVSRAEATDLYGPVDDKTINNNLYVDLFFGSQRYLAYHHARTGMPTYVYYFSHVLDAHKNDFPGAAHGAETRYVFKTLDTLELIGGDSVFGEDVSEKDRELSDTVSSYWAHFARWGDPNVSPLPEWPAQTAERDTLLEIGQNGIYVREDFMPERWAFIKKHFDDGKL